ncbi:MAG TPA: lysophospholipid acyltransferase family protein, partial [Ignavibacteria bacterium]|nr:lysophospholipid acyltransferase family protein [Ignavibacteria bacterium]
MITAKKNSVIGSLFAFYHKRLLKKHFYRIHLNGRDNLTTLGMDTPVILAANHSNWWDGFIAYYLTNRLMKCDDFLMMDIEQLRKYKFFRYVGVFSVDRKNPAEAMRSINYAADLIKNTNRCLWIFPQGEMTPQDKRPLVLYSGISKIAERAGKVKIIPAAFRYEFLMEQRPEVFISIGKPVEFTAGNKNFTA